MLLLMQVHGIYRHKGVFCTSFSEDNFKMLVRITHAQLIPADGTGGMGYCLELSL